LTTEEIILSEIARKRELKLKEKVKNQQFYLKALKEKNLNNENIIKRSKTLSIVTKTQSFNLQTD